MAKLLMFAVLIAAFAIFLSLDVFKDTRNQIVPYIPTSVLFLWAKIGSYIYSVNFKGSKMKERLFTAEEMALYNGKDGGKIYLSIIGKVFDVSSGRKMYGPGETYNCFAGRDGSRAFVTGEFNEEGLIEDVSDFTPTQIRSLHGWLSFYETNDKYPYLGKLTGQFYDSSGSPTSGLHLFDEGVLEYQRLEKVELAFREKLPHCNSEWAEGKGGRVWCSTKSGGVNRKWTGVPRLYHKPGTEKPRCVCVRNTGPPSDLPEGGEHKNRGDLDNPQLKEYANCKPKSVSCPVPKD